MLNLLKKDFLIAKKVWIIVMLVAVIFPGFICLASGGKEIPSGLVLSVETIVIAVTLFSGIDEEEEKYPKATALITAVGYSRRLLVVKRYLLMYLVYGYCLCVYFVESLALAQLEPINAMGIVVSIFVFTLIASIYLGLTSRLGVRAGRYLVMLVVVMISLGPTIIATLKIKIQLDFIANMSRNSLIASMVVVSILAFTISIMSSLKAYQTKEL